MESNLTPAENDMALAQLMQQRSERESVIKKTEGLLSWTYDVITIAKLQQQRIDAQQRVHEILAEMIPYEQHYSSKRWSRYWIVTNANGHVHSSMSCSSCFATTQYAWLPDCSGMTEDETVAEFGERVCTVCHPSAPVTPGLVGRRDREAQAAYDAEKVAKLAVKLEKALLPDGSALRLNDGSPKTLIAGQRSLLEIMKSKAWYGETHPYMPRWNADIELLLDAISTKTGEDRERIRETYQAKADKSVTKERGW